MRRRWRRRFCPLFFANLYDLVVHPKTFVQSPIFKREGRELVAPFTLEEIKGAIFGSDRTKSASPNDLSVAFFQDNWAVVKNALEGVFKESFERGIF